MKRNTRKNMHTQHDYYIQHTTHPHTYATIWIYTIVTVKIWLILKNKLIPSCFLLFFWKEPELQGKTRFSPDEDHLRRMAFFKYWLWSLRSIATWIGLLQAKTKQLESIFQKSDGGWKVAVLNLRASWVKLLSKLHTRFLGLLLSLASHKLQDISFVFLSISRQHCCCKKKQFVQRFLQVMLTKLLYFAPLDKWWSLWARLELCVIRDANTQQVLFFVSTTSNQKLLLDTIKIWGVGILWYF